MNIAKNVKILSALIAAFIVFTGVNSASAQVKMEIPETVKVWKLGGGIGAILALLFAPKSGKELRGEIGGAANKGLDKAEAFAGKASDKAGDIYQDTKTKAGEVYDAAKQKLDSAKTSQAEIAILM